MPAQAARLRPAATMLAAALFPSAMSIPAPARGASRSGPYDIPEAASELTRARVQAMNTRTREVTLAGADAGGQTSSIYASDPSGDVLLQSLKVGDLVTAVVSPPVAIAIEPERRLPREPRGQLNR